MPDSTAREGTITMVEQQQRNKKRYNIYIDREYAFSVHEDVLIELHLVKGKVVNAQTLEEILLSEEKKKVERAIVQLLSYRPRTEFEVIRYLREKGFHEDTIKQGVSSFVKRGFINDKEFARQWMSERIRTKKKGVYLLSAELKQKGVSSAIIEEIARDINLDEEREACYALALKKIGTDFDFEDRKKEYKLKQYLLRRGFSAELIHTVYEQLIKEKW